MPRNLLPEFFLQAQGNAKKRAAERRDETNASTESALMPIDTPTRIPPTETETDQSPIELVAVPGPRTNALVPTSLVTELGVFPPVNPTDSAPGGPRFSQTNTQTINNTCNNYTYNTTNNTSTSNTNTNTDVSGDVGGIGDGGGRGNGGWWSSRGPCGLSLTWLLIIIVLVVLAAVYGIATFWNNTVTALSKPLSAVVWIMTLGKLGVGSASGASSGTAIITPSSITVTATTIIPTPIFEEPSGIVSAIDDCNFWVSRLDKWTQTETHLKKHELFLSENNVVGFAPVGEIRDAFVIVVEDIKSFEKRLVDVIAPLNRDMDTFIQELRAHPGTKRWYEQNNGPLLSRIPSFIPWFQLHKSPLRTLQTYHERGMALSKSARAIKSILSADLVEGTEKRLEQMRKGSCNLRNAIEKAGSGLNKLDDETFAIAVSQVVARGNMLCDTFARSRRRVDQLKRLIKALEAY
ncbi:hypothetical protein DER44DRAFT_856514 [Fusarium oxysporum]|nr:hypothetical protein DER44DRAFT_856514 [Fusarium oxysporum]